MTSLQTVEPLTLHAAGLPFIGSVFDLNKGEDGYFWFKFTEWSKAFGPIYRYKAFGKINIVVNTEKMANDLLRERGEIYSSRENLPMASQLLSAGKKALFLPYGGKENSTSRPTKESLILIHTYLPPQQTNGVACGSSNTTSPKSAQRILTNPCKSTSLLECSTISLTSLTSTKASFDVTLRR